MRTDNCDPLLEVVVTACIFNIETGTFDLDDIVMRSLSGRTGKCLDLGLIAKFLHLVADISAGRSLVSGICAAVRIQCGKFSGYVCTVGTVIGGDRLLRLALITRCKRKTE